MLLFPRPPPSPATIRYCRGWPGSWRNLNSSRLVSLAPPRASLSSSSSSLSNQEDVDTFTKYSGYLFELSSSEADSLTEYDVSKIAAIYQKKPLILLRRLFQTAATLGKWFALRYIDSLSERAEEMFEVIILICFIIRMCF